MFIVITCHLMSLVVILINVTVCHTCPLATGVEPVVYFMAIIDVLTLYGAKKKAAHAAKTMKHGVSVCVCTCVCARVWCV